MREALLRAKNMYRIGRKCQVYKRLKCYSHVNSCLFRNKKALTKVCQGFDKLDTAEAFNTQEGSVLVR